MSKRGEQNPKTDRASAITRRDFVGSVLMGSGAALLSMGSPSALRPAAAQTLPVPLTGLGPDWTGPGGVGDYVRANGNTHEVVNVAHAGIRNKDFARLLARATDTGESYDVVIVGCGLAGLAAAHTYHRERPNASLLLLDQHPVFGGEAKQNEFDVDGYRVTGPQGSTSIPPSADSGTASGRIREELGFPDSFELQQAQGLSKSIRIPEDAWIPMHPGQKRTDTGFFYESKGWVSNPWHNGFREAPIPEKGRQALITLDGFRGQPPCADWHRWLDSMTYEQFLSNELGFKGEALSEVTRYINPVAAAYGCGLGADVISAYSALSFGQPGVISYAWPQNGQRRDSHDAYLISFPGGNAGIARALVKQLIPDSVAGSSKLSDVLSAPLDWDAFDRAASPVRIRHEATVLSVTHDGPLDSAKGVRIVFRKGSTLYTVRAKAAILASQQHVNRNICGDIPSEYREAMETFHHAPMLVVNVALRNWRFLEKLGIAAARWFDGFGWWLSLRRNLVLDGRELQPLNPSKPVVLTLYNPFCLPGLPLEQQCTNARMQLFSTPFAAIEAGVREQFTKMFASAGFDANRDIAGIVSNRWGHAYVVDPPGFFFGKNGKPAPRDIIRNRYRRLAFAHSELSGVQSWGNAAQEGERAARQILEIT